jgi:hypothetical protein
MATFNKDKLTLVHQGIAGARKQWHYGDTGTLIADVQEVDGFFSNGYDCGMRHGDWLILTEGDTGTYDTTGRQTGGRKSYGLPVLEAVDTGATQIRLGAGTLLGDSS